MSGTYENIIKECGAVWSRLFDHRQFLHGEITFFVREFEEKRSDREVENLFEILEKSTEIKDSQIDKLKHSSRNNLSDFQSVVDNANQLCNKVLDERCAYNPEESLLAKCASLEADNKKFEEDLAAKYKAVDESFAEKEKLLREYYQQLSDQLNQSMNN